MEDIMVSSMIAHRVGVGINVKMWNFESVKTSEFAS